MSDFGHQTVYYGASYSPLIFLEEAWDSDLSLMRSASMNLVRIGDVHGSWDRIEPQPGQFDLDLLGHFYEKCDQYGIEVLLSTGTSSPPLWLATRHPDVSLLSSRGERYPLGASYHWACIHHPAFLQFSEKYVQTLANFAVNHSNHFGWQISNEIGFPFMPAREQNELGLYCYCNYCQEKFREWVSDKYQTLDTLTTAWSWSTTNFVYNDWSEVRAPESLPASWSGVTRWIDWRLFWQDAMAKFAGWQHRIIREIDSDHPTSVNTFNFKGYDRFGTFMGLDQWKIARHVDHIGYDLYPGSGDKRAARPEHNSIFLDHGRSVSESVGSDFWIHEIESGPIGGWLMGPQYSTTEKDILNYMIESLGHHAKLFLYMPWREWSYQPIRWGALVDLDGNPTARLRAAGTIGKTLQENSTFIMQAEPPTSQVAVLESKPNAIFFRGVDDEEILFRAQRGAYRAFWDRYFSVDFIDQTGLISEKKFTYKHICLPLIGLLSTNNAQRLAEYVRQGGIVIGFSRLATLDTNGWFHHQLPISGIKELFGIEKIEAEALRAGSIEFQGNQYPTHLNRDLLEVSSDTKVLGRFSDGKPAITFNRSGKGGGIYIATQADSAYVGEPQNPLLGDVIDWVNDAMQIYPGFTISKNNRAVEIDPHVIETSEKTWVLFSNYSNETKSVEFKLRDNERTARSASINFPRMSGLDVNQKNGEITFNLEFQSKEVKIVQINWS